MARGKQTARRGKSKHSSFPVIQSSNGNNNKVLGVQDTNINEKNDSSDLWVIDRCGVPEKDQPSKKPLSVKMILSKIEASDTENVDPSSTKRQGDLGTDAISTKTTTNIKSSNESYLLTKEENPTVSVGGGAPTTAAGRGRGRGRIHTLPEWMTKKQKEDKSDLFTIEENPTVAVGPVTMAGRGRGRGRANTLPAWMTQKQKQDFMIQNPTAPVPTIHDSVKEEYAASAPTILDCMKHEHAGMKRKADQMEDTTKDQHNLVASAPTVHDSKNQEHAGMKRSTNQMEDMTMEHHSKLREIASSVETKNRIVTAFVKAAEKIPGKQITKGAAKGAVSLQIKVCAVCQDWLAQDDFSRAMWDGKSQKPRTCEKCEAKHSPTKMEDLLAERAKETKEKTSKSPKKARKRRGEKVSGGKSAVDGLAAYQPAIAKETDGEGLKDSKAATKINVQKTLDDMSKVDPLAVSKPAIAKETEVSNDSFKEVGTSKVQKTLDDVSKVDPLAAYKAAPVNPSKKRMILGSFLEDDKFNTSPLIVPESPRTTKVPKNVQKMTASVSTGNKSMGPAGCKKVHEELDHFNTTSQPPQKKLKTGDESSLSSVPFGWEDMGMPPPLPLGWLRHWDSGVGRYYFHKTADGSTQWDRPFSRHAALIGGDVVEPLPVGWTTYLHPTYKEICYYHRMTCKWTWERPVRGYATYYHY